MGSERVDAARGGRGGRWPRGAGVPLARTASCIALLLACAALLVRGQGETPAGLSIEVDPGALTLEIGETAQLSATVRTGGAVVDDATVVYYSRARRSVSVTRTGRVEAYRSGQFVLVALVPSNPGDRSRRPDARARVEIPVTVPLPPIAEVAFTEVPDTFYVGTQPRLDVVVTDTVGARRDDVPVTFATSDPAVATLDRFGFLALHGSGTVTVTATVDTERDALTIEVVENPVAALALEVGADAARTGDVLRFTATATDASGREVPGVPVRFAVGGETAPAIVAAGAPAHIAGDGRFVAERSGTYTVIATAGTHTATRTVSIEPRDVAREVRVVGRGKVLDRRSSDLWVWEGTDGRDYAITGTWGADGHTYFWDVTDPASIEKVNQVQVDARTVNDVKVSADGELAVISREGASNRRNGFVVLGAGNPREGVPVLSEFTSQLTGGVHNVFVDGDHVYALSAGRRYDIICLLYTSPSPRDGLLSRMPSSA